MGDSKIEWTDKTWNPVTGCTKVSQGCKHCYAERIAGRMWATQYSRNPDGTARKFTDVRCHPDRLNQPLSWRKPAMVFVNSMSDLFHEDVPDSFICDVFTIMRRAEAHTFQVLTKRPERMADFMARLAWRSSKEPGERGYYAYLGDPGSRPLPNVWLGVSVEDQANADKRVPLLLQTPAHVRFVSAEPLLGPVDLVRAVNQLDWLDPASLRPGGIDWVIVGGESGPGARPMRSEWARLIREQCQAAGVAFFFKQWGEHEVGGKKIGKHAAGRILDGRTWDEFPQAVTA